jgi:hypothetical protein
MTGRARGGAWLGEAWAKNSGRKIDISIRYLTLFEANAVEISASIGRIAAPELV